MTPGIVIELLMEERAPRVLLRAMTEGDEARLTDWIASQDDLADLVARAVELAEEARAA